MGNDQGQPKTVDFTLNARTPSKRPEQLAALLEQALQREFPESGAVVEISHTPQTSVVSLRNLEQLEEGTATALTHKARAIYNEFMNQPVVLTPLLWCAEQLTSERAFARISDEGLDDRVGV